MRDRFCVLSLFSLILIFTSIPSVLAEINEGSFEFPNGGIVYYSYENGNVIDMLYDEEVKSLIIKVNGYGDGSLGLAIERNVLDAKSGSQDVEFFVLVNGEQVDFSEERNSYSRSIGIAMLSTDTEVEIIGTQVLGTTFSQSGNTYQSILKYYVDPLPSWASYAEGVIEDATAAWVKANPGLEFRKVNSPAQADFRIAWVKDFGGLHVGYALGDFYVEIGLGDSFCNGYWLAYNPSHITSIATHEIGHVLGFEHSNDPNDIMYPEALDRQYLSEDYELTSTAGYLHFLPICSVFEVTSYNFDISIDDPNGFDVYFVPSVSEYENYGVTPTFNHYSTRGCWAENVQSFSGTCNGVSNQGGLLVVMPDKVNQNLVTVSATLQETSSTSGGSSLTKFHEDTEIFTGSSFLGTADIKTDKPSYNFGEILDIRGTLSEPSRGLKVHVIITDPLGQMVSKSTLVTTGSGEFQTMASIPNFHQPGSFTITVYNTEGRFLGDTNVKVGKKSTISTDSQTVQEIPSFGKQEKFKKYSNGEFGFTISYPESWTVDESYAEPSSYPEVYDMTYYPVGFYDDEEGWESYFEIKFIKNDKTARENKGGRYLTALVELLRDDCKIASFEVEGFACSNHSIIDSKIIQIDGRQAYQVKESWTETWPDQTIYRNIRLLTDIPIGNNVWTLDSTTVSSEFPRFSNTILESFNSFHILQPGEKLVDLGSDKTPPLIMTPSDIIADAEDAFGAFVDYSVKAIDDADGIIKPNCIPSTSSYFPIGKTQVKCSAVDIAGNLAEKSFTVTINSKSVVIPEWIKNVAGFWCKGEIEDSNFVEGIQYLINNKVIMVSAASSGSQNFLTLPEWIKNNACWWSQGQIGDADFASGLEFLIRQGILSI